MDFSVTIDSSAPDAVVRPRGELDVFSAFQLARSLHDAVDKGCRRVLLDLEDITFIDAGALRTLDRLRSQLAASGASLRLVAWSPRFEQLCRVTGLDVTFGLVPDAQPA